MITACPLCESPITPREAAAEHCPHCDHVWDTESFLPRARSAEARRERLASFTAEDIIASIKAWWEARDCGHKENALRFIGEAGDAIRSLARQRDALRMTVEAQIDECECAEECRVCLRLRAALEVR